MNCRDNGIPLSCELSLFITSPYWRRCCRRHCARGGLH